VQIQIGIMANDPRELRDVVMGLAGLFMLAADTGSVPPVPEVGPTPEQLAEMAGNAALDDEGKQDPDITPEKAAKKGKGRKAAAPKPEPESAPPAPQPEVKPPAPAVQQRPSIDEIRVVLQDYQAAHDGTSELRAKLDSRGVKKVSDLTTEELLKLLAELKAETPAELPL
jgi:hypothetical protein